MMQRPSLYAKRVSVSTRFRTFIYRNFVQKYLLWKFKKKKVRCLEIGPGEFKIPNFETLNLVKNSVTDFVGDIYSNLPFCDNSFDIVYASHVLEHVPWYMVDDVFREWCRIVKVGGLLEIWVPDGLKIAQAYVDAENTGSLEWKKDNWFRFNERQDPANWFSGRMFSYGDGHGTRGHHNWHLSSFSPRLLKDLFMKNGFDKIVLLNSADCRGYDHGWINLGFRGEKSLEL